MGLHAYLSSVGFTLASIISDKHPGEPGLLVTGGEEVKHKEWIKHVKVGIEISICTQC